MSEETQACWKESCNKPIVGHCTADNREYCQDHVHGGEDEYCCLELVDLDMQIQEEQKF